MPARKSSVEQIVPDIGLSPRKMTSDLAGPLIYLVFGVVLIGIGTSRWVGWWKSWHEKPGIRERRIQWALGQSPLPFVFFGIPFLLVDMAVLALALGAGLLTLLFPIAALASVVMGVILLVRLGPA